MSRQYILDTGPIVAFLREKDRWHDWASEQFGRYNRFVTCEPVIAEACAIIQRLGGDPADVLEFIESGAIALEFQLSETVVNVRWLMGKYRDQPMDLADACLVQMSEYYPDCVIMTLDSDFKVFRRRGREVIPLIIPD